MVAKPGIACQLLLAPGTLPSDEAAGATWTPGHFQDPSSADARIAIASSGVRARANAGSNIPAASRMAPTAAVGNKA